MIVGTLDTHYLNGCYKGSLKTALIILENNFLEKYGLKKEMTEDTESLNKKATIIKNYLITAEIDGIHR